MARKCSVCGHANIREIDRALVEGEAYRTVAKRFAASEPAMYRHSRDHLAPIVGRAKEAHQAAIATLVEAREVAEDARAGTLFERLRELNATTQQILREAREAGNNVVALQAINRAEKQLELEAKLLGELDESTKVAVGIHVDSEPRGEVWDRLIAGRQRVIDMQKREG